MLTASLQERPCTRCLKRNIGHLCHDEPREQSKKNKQDPNDPNLEQNVGSAGVDVTMGGLNPANGLTLSLPQDPLTSTANLVQPTPVHTPHPSLLGGNNTMNSKWKIPHRKDDIDKGQCLEYKIGCTIHMRNWRKICTIYIHHICSTRQKSRMNTAF
jgi:hypothetical protein